MSGMIDKVITMTIQAKSIEEAELKAKSQLGVKHIIKSELSNQIFDVTVIQEWYGKYNLGYCKHCGADLCCRVEFVSETCDECEI
jgi:hypothetical protein